VQQAQIAVSGGPPKINLNRKARDTIPTAGFSFWEQSQAAAIWRNDQYASGFFTPQEKPRHTSASTSLGPRNSKCLDNWQA